MPGYSPEKSDLSFGVDTLKPMQVPAEDRNRTSRRAVVLAFIFSSKQVHKTAIIPLADCAIPALPVLSLTLSKFSGVC